MTAATTLEFAESMERLVEGKATVAEVRRFGAGGSSDDAILFYREMVRRQRRGILDGFFAAARLACKRAQGGRWERLAERYIREHPPRAWNPNAWAVELPLHAARLAPDLAADETALLDYACVRYRAMHASHGPVPRLDADVFVRLYPCDVTPYSERAEVGEAPPPPARRATPLLVTRSRTTGRMVVYRAAAATLLALEEALLGGVGGASDPRVEDERARLVELGVLPAALPATERHGS